MDTFVRPRKPPSKAAEASRTSRSGATVYPFGGGAGGDPQSIAFCERTGPDYVGASPFRVPIARLTGVQASMRFPAHGVVSTKHSTRGNSATMVRPESIHFGAEARWSGEQAARYESDA